MKRRIKVLLEIEVPEGNYCDGAETICCTHLSTRGWAYYCVIFPDRTIHRDFNKNFLKIKTCRDAWREYV